MTDRPKPRHSRDFSQFSHFARPAIIWTVCPSGWASSELKTGGWDSGPKNSRKSGGQKRMQIQINIRNNSNKKCFVAREILWPLIGRARVVSSSQKAPKVPPKNAPPKSARPPFRLDFSLHSVNLMFFFRIYFLNFSFFFLYFTFKQRETNKKALNSAKRTRKNLRKNVARGRGGAQKMLSWKSPISCGLSSRGRDRRSLCAHPLTHYSVNI